VSKIKNAVTIQTYDLEVSIIGRTVRISSIDLDEFYVSQVNVGQLPGGVHTTMGTFSDRLVIEPLKAKKSEPDVAYVGDQSKEDTANEARWFEPVSGPEHPLFEVVGGNTAGFEMFKNIAKEVYNRKRGVSYPHPADDYGMDVGQLIRALADYPDKTMVEVCVGNADLEVNSLTPVVGDDTFVTINLGDVICTHGGDPAYS
jgi:hypothetical protein